MLVLLTLLGLLSSTISVQFNGFEDFESLTADNGWMSKGCTIELSNESFSGDHSVKVSNRNFASAGIHFNVSVEPNKNYFIQGNIKLLNTPVGLTSVIKIIATIQKTSGVEKYVMGFNKYMQEGIWQEVGGDIVMPADTQSMTVTVLAVDKNVNYLLDAVSFGEILPLPSDWKTTADMEIKKLRTETINITTSGIEDPSQVRVLLTQDRSEFPFGSCIQSDMMVDPAFIGYQNFFYNAFEWATLCNKLKWKQMEKVRGVIDHDTPRAAIDALRSRGIKIRGHAVFWGIEKNVPVWQIPLPYDQINDTNIARLDDIIPYTKGLLEHWDVNNENVHGDFYEVRTGDVNYTQWMFREVHKRDPDVKLFLNDYGILNERFAGSSYYNQGKMFKEAGVPIHGFGIQSHLNNWMDPSVLKYRLDRIARVGLPIWITELDFSDVNKTSQAEYIDDVLRLYFSHPSVEGIILWGYWSGRIGKPEAALADGPADDVKPNEGGQKLLDLIKKEWRSEANRSLRNGWINQRLFRGDYTIQIKVNRTLVHTDTFSVPKGGLKLDINFSNGVVVTTYK